MSLSLSELFQQSQAASQPKKEDDGDPPRRQTKNSRPDPRAITDPRRSKPNKRKDRSESGSTTSHRKRIKPESSRPDDEEITAAQLEESHITEEYDGEDYDPEEYGERDGFGNNDYDAFYEKYPQTAKTLYQFQTPKQEDIEEELQQQPPITSDHSDALGAIHSALFPSRSQGAIALGNERRLAGEYDDGGGGDDSFPSKSLRGRYKPRKKRVREEGPSGKKEVTFRLETQGEVEGRVKKLEGYTERSMTRMRWKQRTVNFQSEEDVGNAFLTRAEDNLGEQLRTDEEKLRAEENKERKRIKKERVKEERKRLRELEQSDDLEEEDEVKEQSQLLAHFSQKNDILLKKEDEDPIQPDTGGSSAIIPQGMDYWERGYSMPQKSFSSFDLNPSVKKIVHSSASKIKSEEKDESGVDVLHENEAKASFGTLMKGEVGLRSCSRFFFQPNRTLITNANSTFRPGYKIGHVQHLLNMAARSLCGGGGAGSIGEIELENRYIRLLCAREPDSSSTKKRDVGPTICANFRTRGYLTAASEEQGRNMLLYLHNAWDDPVEVAKQLGILDCYQDSPLQGNMLTSLKHHFKKIRSKIKKHHKVRSTNWNHDGDNDESEYRHDLEEESVVKDDPNVVPPEVTTSGGVIEAMTADTSMTTNKKTFQIPYDQDALISPNNLYCHIAGTSPPIPLLPLDPTSCLFGPVDRHSKFFHGAVKMDSSVYKIMLSTLMKRIALARNLKKHSLSSKTQKQALDLIEEFADVNENKFYLLYTNFIQDPSDSDIPLVEFNRGVAGYCSFIANGYNEMRHSETPTDQNDDDSDKYYGHDDDGSLVQSSGVSLLAEKIWEFCRTKIRSNGLMRFPRLKITYGVALICRSLPPSAAEILSRPIEDDGHSTPLTLFKQTLEDLEIKKSITSNRHYEDQNLIRAVELEFLFHDAAEFFQDAVKLDPINVEYQLWHIGCLASCLVISSGNKISNSVHLYPSQKRGHFGSHDTADHEVRHCLKKYHEVRIELSSAVRALLTLAKYQDSPKAHFAVTSLLEWGQVIGLLVGCSLDKYLEDIRGIHAFHFGEWAKTEPSTFLRDYKSLEKTSLDASLHAQILENQPGEIENWRNFVQCLEPGSMKKGKTGDEWWGKNRCWWGDSLLHISIPNVDDRTFGSECYPVINNVLAELENRDNARSIPAYFSSVTDTKMNEDDDGKSDYQNTEWLPTREDIVVKNEDSDVTREVRSRCYGDKVPSMSRNISDSTVEGSQPLAPSTLAESSSLPKLSSLSLEALAYKILIFCRLFGSDHPSLYEYIYYHLFRNCSSNGDAEQIDINCDEFQVLVWFVSMGMDIEKIMRDKL